ncbi:major facilitator superfamily protein [Klebsormidium nitens]|uniref:Major facilitator superfamily protein n=1 Tax=Klebsormidium nitens TaxID=105231 RepID=A0A1Y1HWH6_KLENI|nr:major facilitator superfamily protein [Klebsormidium nitens]|eukprot:GAQ81331.1 major facilitator superfamily protein [Klebsormidium nitens]
MGRWSWKKVVGAGARADPATTPLPSTEMVVIFLIHLSQGFQVTMLFPLIVFMVTDFGVAEHNPHLVGRYAGFLASLFPFAQFCTSLFWGSVSDRTGRKPVLFSGNVVAAVSALLFGLSGSYTMACLVRLVGGLLNGVITVTKSTLGELCDKTNQRQGFAVLSLGWGIGTIAGQVIGGVGARPCQQYGIEKCPAVLKTYPFILPCAGAAFFSGVAAVATFFLRETLVKEPGFAKIEDETFELVETKPAKGSGSVSVSEGQSGELEASLEDFRARSEGDEERGFLLEPLESKLRSSGKSKVGRSSESAVARIVAQVNGGANGVELVSRGEHGMLSGDFDTTTERRAVESGGAATRGTRLEENALAGTVEEAAEPSVSGRGKTDSLANDGKHDELKLGVLLTGIGNGKGAAKGRTKVDGVRYEKLPDLESGPDKVGASSSIKGGAAATKDRFYWQDPDVWIASGTYGMTAFIHIIGDELFPIFGAASPASGGLGYAASTIGLLGGLTGAVLFLFTLVFLKLNPPSARACFALGTLLYLPATLLMPLTSLLTSNATWQWWAVAGLLIEKNVAACMGFTGAMVLVSNSTDSSNMGAVTGFSHSIGAFARAAGPFLGGSLWSYSVALRIPLSQFIPWECITVLTLGTLVLAVLAKPYLDGPKSERNSS